MKIVLTNKKKRVLITDDNKKISVNDGDIIQYTGIYHKIINDIVRKVEIETTFVGVVFCEKYRHNEGIIGLYVEPLYIWNKMCDEWNRIINFKPPDGSDKYFLYPHLLLVSNPHCFLYTENKSLEDFTDERMKCVDLNM